jgi:hypothetical protein
MNHYRGRCDAVSDVWNWAIFGVHVPTISNVSDATDWATSRNSALYVSLAHIVTIWGTTLIHVQNWLVEIVEISVIPRSVALPAKSGSKKVQISQFWR